jgi:hypothetical protein
MLLQGGKYKKDCRLHQSIILYLKGITQTK